MDEERAERKARKDRAGNVTAGLIMITIGVLFLTGQLGLASIRDLWHWWPLVLIAIGLTHLVLGGEEAWDGGVFNILLGTAFLAINFEWLGFGWRTGWPLILVAIGASMMLKAAFGPRRRDGMAKAVFGTAPRRHREESGATVVEEERHD